MTKGNARASAARLRQKGAAHSAKTCGMSCEEIEALELRLAQKLPERIEAARRARHQEQRKRGRVALMAAKAGTFARLWRKCIS